LGFNALSDALIARDRRILVAALLKRYIRNAPHLVDGFRAESLADAISSLIRSARGY